MVRSFTTLLDSSYITNHERELYKNIISLRDFIKDLIKVKREEISRGIKKVDFLSLMLEDELYKDNEERMVDECTSIMFAATQTTAINISETLFRLT